MGRGPTPAESAGCIAGAAEKIWEAVAFIASRQQGGRQGSRKLLDSVKSVLDTLRRVKKCIRLKFEKLTGNFYSNQVTG